MPVSANRISAIDRERMTNHETGGGATEPEHSACNLLGATEPADRHVLQHRVEGIRLSGHHLVEHRRMDDTWAHGINANAPGCVIQCGAFGQPKHAVFGGLVCSAFGATHQSSDRGTVDDSAAA